MATRSASCPQSQAARTQGADGVLPESDSLRYARQLLLPEIGTRGQALLCAAPTRIGPGDARAHQVAAGYLSRAGLPLMASENVTDAAAPLEVAIADAARVAQL